MSCTVYLKHLSHFTIKPNPPYNFDLTVRKPAGWSLFSPLEIYEEGTLWTAVHLDNTLVGLSLTSAGTTDSPIISGSIHLERKPQKEKIEKINQLLVHCLGADDKLEEFYRFSKKDMILKLVIEDLYGMHSTSNGDNIFPDSLLAITLQMAPMKRSNQMMECLITKYGDAAEFEGKTIHAWPTPQRLANQDPAVLAETCKLGYRTKNIVRLASKLVNEPFPTLQQLEALSPEESKLKLLELPGIGDYSADIINPHGGFPIDVWSAEIFAKLFFGKEPQNNRQAIKIVKSEGIKRWGKWSWMAFFYVVQDLKNLSKKLDIELRLF